MINLAARVVSLAQSLAFAAIIISLIVTYVGNYRTLLIP